jgi:hypothetical protein
METIGNAFKSIGETFDAIVNKIDAMIDMLEIAVVTAGSLGGVLAIAQSYNYIKNAQRRIT